MTEPTAAAKAVSGLPSKGKITNSQRFSTICEILNETPTSRVYPKFPTKLYAMEHKPGLRVPLIEYKPMTVCETTIDGY
jgi:hypothetical protein